MNITPRESEKVLLDNLKVNDSYMYKGIPLYVKEEKELGYFWCELPQDDFVEIVRAHFKDNFTFCLFPAKAYFVTIVYAYALSQVLDTNIMNELKSLVFYDLPYFKCYEEDPNTYEDILDGLTINPNKGTVPLTLRHFEEEFNVQDIDYKTIVL